MRLEWSLLALSDREEIFDYIEADNPKAAVDIDLRIETSAEKLIDFPLIGRLGRVDGTPELVITDTPFVAAYIITDDAVRILRVLHGARMWPDEMAGN